MRVGRGALALRGRPEPPGISFPKIALLDSVYSMSFSAVSIPVHDNFLLSYSVFGREKEIRFRTASPDDEPHEYTDVIFSGVIPYHFEHYNLQALFDEDRFVFRYGRKQARPLVCEPKEDLLCRIHEEDVRTFGVQSSRSLSGWVWAQSGTRCH